MILPKNFYPTPTKLIEKMLSCVEIKEYINILEPSAVDYSC